jgi:RNA 2',3'-cyclic 3'-phosphodiesterase
MTRAAPIPQSHLFFAVFVPPELHAPLEAAQAPVKTGWKLTPAPQLHVTLAFLGEAKQLEMKTLLEVGRTLSSTVKPFTATLRGTGFFPLDGSPRVWFLKAEAPEFNTLATTLQTRLELQSDFKFHPHVTLARKKDRGPKPPTLSLNLSFEVSQFALVRSFLERGGSRFKTLEKFFLASPAPPTALYQQVVER